MKGYATDEVVGRLAGSLSEVGVSKWDLDTRRCASISIGSRPHQTMQAAVRRFGLATRPHAKTHRSADIAKLQLAAGAIGVCCAKLGEAEALMPHGIDRICMTTANLSPPRFGAPCNSASGRPASSRRWTTSERARSLGRGA